MGLLLLITYHGAIAEVLSANEDTPLSQDTTFSHYVLDDSIPKLSMNLFAQHEHMVAHVDKTIIVGDETKQTDVFVKQSIDAKGNLDLRIRYQANKQTDSSDYLKALKDMARTEYRLRKYAQSYDPKSVVITEQDERHTKIEFKYSKFGLPQDIAYFRFMKVEIDLVDEKPVSLTITNRDEFEYEGYRIQQYRQDITFDLDRNGKAVLKSKIINASGTTFNGKKPVSMHMISTPVFFYDKETKDIDVRNEALLKEYHYPTLIEEELSLTRTLPILGDAVRRQGIDLPLPYGVSFVYRNQDMNFNINDINLMGANLNQIFDTDTTSASVRAQSVGIRGDVYLLPFLNVYGMIGKLDIDANVQGDYTGALGNSIRDSLNNRLDGAGDFFCNRLSGLCTRSQINLPVHLRYDVVSTGLTLSVGYRNIFASLTGSYSLTKLEGESEWGDPIITAQPMIGYNWVDYRTQIFVGMEYQFVKPYFRGKVDQIDVGGKPFSYDIGVDLSEEAYMVGFNKEIDQSYMLTFLYSMGETRSSATLNFAYRF